MRNVKCLMLLVFAAIVPLAAQTQSVPSLPYSVVEGWSQIPAEITMGAVMGVAVDSLDNVWIYNRGSHPIIQFNKDGKVLHAWGENTATSTRAKSAHGLRVSPDGTLWLVDREAHSVSQFSTEGQVLTVIGTFGNNPGDNDAEYAFNSPANVFIDREGIVYVADGYRNSRVAQYTDVGEYVGQWGEKGEGEGQFNLVHDVVMDSESRVYVADRGNNRIQIFDDEGELLGQWENIGVPWGLAYDGREDVIYTTDGDSGLVRKLSMDGEILGAFGSVGKEPGQFDQAHYLAVDSEGSIYVAETNNARIQKFIKDDN